MNKATDGSVRAYEEGVCFMNNSEHVCGNYDDDDTVCRTCSDNRVQRQQSCYVPGCVKPGKTDAVEDKVHPDHYKQDGRRECIDEMIILFGRERVADWCRLTAYKYLYRHGNKKGESAETDLKKMDYYLAKAEQLTRYE